MYVILTSKPGQFHTESGAGLHPVQAYDYLFYGRRKAHFVIAELQGDPSAVRVRVVDEADSPTLNLVPAKFLEKFDTVEQAYAELEYLTRFGAMDTALVPVSP